MGTKTPNPVDLHVGKRVRQRRLMRGMSQDALGTKLGITFQQIQKYEKGTNRIGASRLQQIADVLGVSPSYFFQGAPGAADADHAEPDPVQAVAATSDGLRLVKAFSRIEKAEIRRRVVALVESMAPEEDGTMVVHLQAAE